MIVSIGMILDTPRSQIARFNEPSSRMLRVRISLDDAMLVKIVKADCKLTEPLSLKVDAGSCSGL